LVFGYVWALVHRSPRLEHPGARAVLRADQRLSRILRRRREALGRTPGVR
jgi:hypothetical protein